MLVPSLLVKKASVYQLVGTLVNNTPIPPPPPKAMMQDKSTLAVRKGEMGTSKEVTTGSTEIAGAEVQKLVGDGKQNGGAAEAEVE